MKRIDFPTAVMVYVGYNAIIFLTWFLVGANYTDMVSQRVAALDLVLPLSLGALFLALVLTKLGLWGDLFRVEPGLAKWPVIPFVLCGCVLMAGNALNSPVGRLAASHVATLALAGVIVGFNEETLNRGLLVAGLRTFRASEFVVYLGSTALFGAMHVPNAMFGFPISMALAQAACAFMLGSGLYVLRRVSGTLYAPIAFHGVWDFTAFISEASGGGWTHAVLFQLGTYALGLASVVCLFMLMRRAREEKVGSDTL